MKKEKELQARNDEKRQEIAALEAEIAEQRAKLKEVTDAQTVSQQ